MTSTKTLVAITVLFLIIECQFSIAQELGWPIIRNYTPKEYQNTPQIFSVFQDDKGLMYFGCGDGFLIYDGARWIETKTPKKGFVRIFEQDKNGRIYLSGEGDFGYLATNKQGKIEYKSLAYLIPDSSIKISIARSVKITDDKVYFHTYENVFEYLPNENKIHSFEADTNGGFGGDFVHQNTYYIVLSKKGLMKIENGQLVPAPHSTFFKNKNAFRVAARYQPDILLIPTRTDGVFLYSPDPNTPPSVFEIENKDFISDNHIYCSYAFDGAFGLASLRKGVLLFDTKGKSLQVFNEKNLLQTNVTYSICNDKTQNIWLGLENGISKTEHSQDLSYWDKNSGLRGVVISCIRYENTMYVGTGLKVYWIDANNQPQEVQNVPTQAWSFLEFKTPTKKKLLVGTSAGVYEIQKDKAIPIHKGNHAHFLYQSHINPNRVYADDLPNFISLVFENNQFRLEKWDGINDDIRSLEEEPDGNLWLGTYMNGPIKVKAIFDTSGNFVKVENTKYYNENEGFVSLIDINPFRFKDKILFGTQQGLYVHNPQTDHFEPFCELGAHLCEKGTQGVFRFQQMPDGRIYISPSSNENQDVGYLKPNTQGGYDWIYKPFRRLPKMAITSMYAEQNGVVWIGGNEGLFRYNPKADVKNYNADFRTFIRKVIIGIDSVVYYGSLDANLPGFKKLSSFDYEHNSVKFEFAAPFFDQEEHTRYSYQLQGFESDWSGWSSQTEKEYTNLWEGKYTFNAKAKNIYDVESEIGTYQFVILPPFYRTWWAYTLFVVFFLGLGVVILKFYTRNLVKQKEHLEKIVTQRTAEVVQQKEKLTETLDIVNQQKEEIAQTLEVVNQQKEEISQTLEVVYLQKEIIEKSHKHITDSINYARRIQTAVLPHNDFITVLLPQHFIHFKPRDVVSGDFYFVKQIQKHILVAVADCTGHGVPGAFMSMLGIAILNEITNKENNNNAAFILDELRKQIKHSLQQTGQEGETQDGMDIAFCILNYETLEMSFAGANNSCWIFRPKNSDNVEDKTELIVLAADRQPVGVYLRERAFTESKIQLQKNDVFYIFSDGYHSQFGGINSLPLKTRFFKDILSEIYTLPMEEQNDILDTRFDEWRDGNEQTDDVLVIGVKI